MIFKFTISLICGASIMNMKDKFLNKSGIDDEYYTRYEDIESEMSYYSPDVFRDKVVYCCCDSTRSNFFKYFFIKFKSLGLKGLMQTCLDADNTSYVSTMKALKLVRVLSYMVRFCFLG